jgi:hypothetical protein
MLDTPAADNGIHQVYEISSTTTHTSVACNGV